MFAKSVGFLWHVGGNWQIISVAEGACTILLDLELDGGGDSTRDRFDMDTSALYQDLVSTVYRRSSGVLYLPRSSGREQGWCGTCRR